MTLLAHTSIAQDKHSTRHLYVPPTHSLYTSREGYDVLWMLMEQFEPFIAIYIAVSLCNLTHGC